MQKWMSGSAWGSTGYLCDNRYGVLPKIWKKCNFTLSIILFFVDLFSRIFEHFAIIPLHTLQDFDIFILKRWKVRTREKELYCTFSWRKRNGKLFYIPSLDFWRDRRWCLETHQSDSSSFLSNSQDGRDSALKHRKKNFLVNIMQESNLPILCINLPKPRFRYRYMRSLKDRPHQNNLLFNYTYTPQIIRTPRKNERKKYARILGNRNFLVKFLLLLILRILSVTSLFQNFQTVNVYFLAIKIPYILLDISATALL